MGKHRSSRLRAEGTCTDVPWPQQRLLHVERLSGDRSTICQAVLVSQQQRELALVSQQRQPMTTMPESVSQLQARTGWAQRSVTTERDEN